MSSKKDTVQVATPQAPEGIRTVSSQLRSSNLERDTRSSNLENIHVGVRAQDMLERVGAALEDMTRMRAWSLTGPYGTGKSTLALLIDALLGQDHNRRAEADKLVAGASSTLAQRLGRARDTRAPHGLLTAVTTARREPLVETITRALRNGAERTWAADKIPAAAGAAIAALDMPTAGSAEVLAAVRALCAETPVFLIIDEFGKTLEHLAARGEFSSAEDDVFLLQELAEAGAGATGLPLFILTLQHLSFGDYASRSTSLQTREWAKVQGRFEDITMTTHLGDAVHLIQRTLDQSGLSAAARKLVKRHALAASEAWAARGLEGVLPADAELFEAVYPLHPLTVVVAPLLAGQIGQHDRSLSGFLASDEPHTVRRYLTENAQAKLNRVSSVRLAQVYDYFLGTGRTTVLASANASRWIEIDTQISMANGMSDEDQEILKTIGLLNLVDSSGSLRASLDMIMFALTDPTDIADPSARLRLLSRIEALLEGSFLVHRKFSDEYRVWQGSDVDLGSQIDTLMERCDDHEAVKVVGRYLPVAIVAGKQSQQTGMLRHFVTRATDALSAPVKGCELGGPADGVLIFHFGDESNMPVVESQLPGVVGVSGEAKGVLAAARYVHALEEISYDEDLDAVARRELTERLAQANAELATRLAAAFAPNQLAARWYLLRPGSDGRAVMRDGDEPLLARSLAGVVSVACESVYPHTPVIRNEMLGRHQLTSQGAKARRELMAAMLAHPGEQHLGITGYGPERAMYGGVLEFLKLHRTATDLQDPHANALVPYVFAEPPNGSSLRPAWDAMHELLGTVDRKIGLQDVIRTLMAPPFGIKAGVVPIVVLAALILGEQELAVFENGTYQPRLSDALIERMVKAPETFSIKAMGAQSGPREAVVTEISTELSIDLPSKRRPGVRNVPMLSVARDVIDRARTMTSYAKRTETLSESATAVRAALMNATEPDTLLFVDLPTALDQKPVAATGKATKTAAHDYAASLASALGEIGAIRQRQRDRVTADLAEAFRLPQELTALRHSFAAYTKPLLQANLAEPTLQSLIQITALDAMTDDEWLDAAVFRIAGRGMDDWRDSDAEAFSTQAKAMAKALDRLGHLYHAPKPLDHKQPFTTQVLTLTSGDGSEEHAVVHIPEAARVEGHRIAKAALEQAREAFGAQGERILLALLAQVVIGGTAPTDAEPASPPRPVRKKATL